MAEKTPVVLIQGVDNVVRRVRVAGAEFDVMNAALLPIAGSMCLHLTIANVDGSAEPAPIAGDLVADGAVSVAPSEPAPVAEPPAADAA